jgi:homoserine O-acetyltransferase
MSHISRILLLAVCMLLAAAGVRAEGAPKFFELGDFRLENGETIRHCRLAYRTFGVANAGKSNGLLFPTWLAGTTRDLSDTGLIGPGKLADTSQYFVIAVDAFGNGVSSSPSTSAVQPGRAFPRFSIRDMVRAEYLLLTRGLNLPHLHAVVGISMGGMQAFQWMVAYPDYVDRIVSISGTPRPTSYDLLVWQGQVRIIEALRNAGPGNNLAMRAIAPLHLLLQRTPLYYATKVRREDTAASLSAIETSLARFNPDDWASQVRAMTDHDIFASFGGSPEAAARATKARTLIVVAHEDNLVYPGPSRSFARLLKSDAHELKGDCGHHAFICEKEHVEKLAAGFLAR